MQTFFFLSQRHFYLTKNTFAIHLGDGPFVAQPKQITDRKLPGIVRTVSPTRTIHVGRQIRQMCTVPQHFTKIFSCRTKI